MSDVTTPSVNTAGGLGLWRRFWAILTAPREAMAEVVARPRWAAMLCLVLLATVTCTGGYLWSSAGQRAWLAAQAERMQHAEDPVSEADWEAVEKVAPYVGPITIVATVTLVPLVWLVIAGLLYLVFNVGLGGEATFGTVWAVLIHSTAVSVLKEVFVTPLNYYTESATSATNLAVLLPMLDPSGFLSTFLGAIDIFMIWWAIVLAVGLAVLYRRRTAPIAAGLLGVYVVLAALYAAVAAA